MKLERNVFQKHFLEMSKNTVFYFGSPKFFTMENIFYEYLLNLEKISFTKLLFVQ